jgi:hypothetical protein
MPFLNSYYRKWIGSQERIHLMRRVDNLIFVNSCMNAAITFDFGAIEQLYRGRKWLEMIKYRKCG